MTKPLRIFQGADVVIVIDTGLTDLSAATAIEVTIDTPSQIKKTLSSGITAVTATQFNLAIDAADTATVKSGAYRYHCRANINSKKKQGVFVPSRILIMDSVFENAGSGKRYPIF